MRRLMAGEEQESMLPWWRGFKGTIKKTGEHKYDVTGIANKVNDTTVEIVELPIHKWTQTYKSELEAMIGEKGEGVIKVCALPPTPCHIVVFSKHPLVGLQRAPRQHQCAFRH
jgi:hypothetical protein